MLPALLAMKPALGLLRRFWWIIPLVLALLWVWRIDTLRARHLKDLNAAELRHSFTTASLNTCTGQIKDNNRRISEAAAALERQRSEATAALARADARWEASRGRVSALEASARDGTQPPCKVSERASGALEGL